MPKLPAAFQSILSGFAPLFTGASYANFTALVGGWIMCVGRHSISRVIQFAGVVGHRHHSVFYRFFSRARWATDSLGFMLVRMALEIVPGKELLLIVDDTLCRRSGPHIWGAGMHHDPLISSYGRGAGKRKVYFAFGHSWVVVSAWVPLPWNPLHGMAVPIAFRLYRSKKLCPSDHYRKRTQLASELLELIDSWQLDRKIRLTGDSEYACRTVVRALPSKVVFVGPMRMDAALYEPPPPRNKGTKGRPRKKGQRLPSPAHFANDTSVPWSCLTVTAYGRPFDVLIKTKTALWYTVAGSCPVRLVVTRDPAGRIEDRAYFSTDPTMTVVEILSTFARRWSQEVMYRNVKQHVGLDHPQNGWWRRPAGHRRPPNQPGPQPHDNRGQPAAERTAPFIFVVYALVVIWYLKHGDHDADVELVRQRCPWYRHKTHPSFADMLAAARRAFWAARLSADPRGTTIPQKFDDGLEGLLAAA